MGDNIVTEHIHILLYHRSKVSDKVLNILHEVWIDIILKTSDTIVVLNESSACSLFHDVEHMLTVAHGVEECRKGTKVLCAASKVEQVRVNTLQLVHNGTHVLDAVSELDTKSLLYDTHECMTVHHCAEVIHTIGECKSLWISIRLTHLLYTTVNISKMRVYAADGLAVEYSLQAKHTVSRGVLGTDVNNKILLAEEHVLLCGELSIAIERVLVAIVCLHVILCGIHIVCKIVVLAERIALEVVPQIQPAHIAVSQELDAQEVVDLTFKYLANLPQMHCCRQHVVVTSGLGNLLYTDALVRLSVFKNVDTSESFLSEVLAYYSNKVVEMFLILQLCHTFDKAVITEFYVF